MEYYLTLLRVVHITSGAVWTGTVVAFALFVIPTVRASGPQGGQFMQTLVKTTGFAKWIASLGGLTVLTGLLLIWELSNGFGNNWMGTRYGIMMSNGGLLAIIGFVLGTAINMPATKKLQKLGAEIAGSEGPPPPDLMQEVGKLQNRMRKSTNAIAILLVASVVFMALAQYSHML